MPAAPNTHATATPAAAKQACLEDLRSWDDLDTRREIFYLISKLTPAERLNFLRWCTERCNSKLRHNPAGGVHVYIQDTTAGHPAETYYDLAALVVHYGLSLPQALQELEWRARQILLPNGSYLASL